MKFNVFLCSFIAIFFNLITLINSAYLFGSDLQFNIPETFKANFSSEADFEEFLKDLIHKLKTRIAEKLYQSFKIRKEIKLNITNKINNRNRVSKEAKALENINDVSHNFHDFVRKIKVFENQSFEKMTILAKSDMNHTNFNASGNAAAIEIDSGFINERNKIKINKNKEVANKSTTSNTKTDIINKNSTIAAKEKENEEDLDNFSEFDFKEFDIKAKRNNISQRSFNIFINKENEEEINEIEEEDDYFYEKQEYYGTEADEGFVNNNNTSKMNKIKHINNNFNGTTIYKNRSKSKREEAFTNHDTTHNKNNFYFFENENFLNSNKSFFDFANIFFNSEKKFQNKIFGKKLIDFFSSDKLNISETLVNSFHKFYLNMQLDKKAVEDKKYSKLKKEIDFFSVLESEKNPSLSTSININNKNRNNNKNLKNNNNRINIDKNRANSYKNESLLSNSNKIKFLDSNKTLSNLLLKTNNTIESRFKVAKLAADSKANRNHESESTGYPSFLFSSPAVDKRTIKIFIDSENECDIFFEDRVDYAADNFTNLFLDHLIMNRKSNFIEPRAIKPKNAEIKYFVFNRKLNMFTIDIEKNPMQNFSINYDYVASGLIDSKKMDTDKAFLDDDLVNDLNFFMWKVYNENTDNKKLNLEIQIYFSFGNDYDYDKIKFNHVFAKNENNLKDKNLTYFSWSGDLLPYEVMSINSFFPIIFRSCGVDKVNISLVILGSLFVILVILSVYLMLINIIKDFY